MCSSSESSFMFLTLFQSVSRPQIIWKYLIYLKLLLLFKDLSKWELSIKQIIQLESFKWQLLDVWSVQCDWIYGLEPSSKILNN
jgi:hypothetical protein